ncbi:MAG: NAD(P)-binding domain-containing protein [Chitinophagaceae bacterium]|nr:NAD(P)-binding domain-containing protein [Chitinophagaceae bacterium]
MNIGIIGSGTMGAGIAQVAATHGNQVIVVDSNQTALQKAEAGLLVTLEKLSAKGKLSAERAAQIAGNISWNGSPDSLSDADLVIEAIVENLEVKQQLFANLEGIVRESCILASNTSSLSITSIASVCRKPERVVGLHFFNPAALMELVEIVPALQTNAAVTDTAREIIDSWNKKTVVAKDTPGFIVNRIARPFYSESIRLYEEGIADIATIDYALRTYGGFKMGAFELMDLIGHDVNYTVNETVCRSFYYDQKYTPSFAQKRLVEARWHGRKSGRGFYNYAENAVQPAANTDEALCRSIAERVIVMLIHEAAHALYLNIASRGDIELAMTKGVNYPKGLLQWGNEWGTAKVAAKLDELYEWYHEDRYRCSPLLRKAELL